MELAGISGDASRNKKLQVTIATEQPDGKKIENVNLDMYKSNGVSFSSSLGSEDNDNTAGRTVTGAPRKTDAAVVLKNSSGSDILIKGIYVKVLDEEDDPDVLQKMTGGITNFRDPAITHQSFDGTEPQGTSAEGCLSMIWAGTTGWKPRNGLSETMPAEVISLSRKKSTRLL